MPEILHVLMLVIAGAMVAFVLIASIIYRSKYRPGTGDIVYRKCTKECPCVPADVLPNERWIHRDAKEVALHYDGEIVSYKCPHCGLNVIADRYHNPNPAAFIKDHNAPSGLTPYRPQAVYRKCTKEHPYVRGNENPDEIWSHPDAKETFALSDRSYVQYTCPHCGAVREDDDDDDFNGT